MGIVTNEKEYAELALRNLDLGEHPTETLNCIAKLYRAQGFSRNKIQDKLGTFLLRCDPLANIVKWQDTLSRMVKMAFKYPLVEIHSIPIMRSEIATCKSIKSIQKQRLLFTLICLARLANTIKPENNGWVNRNDKEIFDLANVKTTQVRQSLLLNDLMTAGLISFSKKVDNINIRVECLDDDGEKALEISDFRNIGNQYMRYNGGKFIECQSCGLVVPRTGYRQKYCTQCAAEENKKKTREYWKDAQKVYFS